MAHGQAWGSWGKGDGMRRYAASRERCTAMRGFYPRDAGTGGVLCGSGGRGTPRQSDLEGRAGSRTVHLAEQGTVPGFGADGAEAARDPASRTVPKVGLSELSGDRARLSAREGRARISLRRRAPPVQGPFLSSPCRTGRKTPGIVPVGHLTSGTRHTRAARARCTTPLKAWQPKSSRRTDCDLCRSAGPEPIEPTKPSRFRSGRVCRPAG